PIGTDAGGEVRAHRRVERELVAGARISHIVRARRLGGSGPAIAVRLAAKICELFPVHYGHFAADVREAIGAAERELRDAADAAPLCRDHDHAVSAAAPVDCGSRGVLEDVDALDAVAVDVAEIDGDWDSVKDVERRIRGRYRADAADADRICGARLEAARRDVNARDATLDGVEWIGGHYLVNVLGFERRNGASDLAAALLTVSDRDHASQLHGLGGEDKIERHTLSRRDSDGKRDWRVSDQARL